MRHDYREFRNRMDVMPEVEEAKCKLRAISELLDMSYSGVRGFSSRGVSGTAWNAMLRLEEIQSLKKRPAYTSK